MKFTVNRIDNWTLTSVMMIKTYNDPLIAQELIETE